MPELFTIFFNAVAHKLERALLQESHLAPRELELLSVLARTLSSRLPGWKLQLFPTHMVATEAAHLTQRTRVQSTLSW